MTTFERAFERVIGHEGGFQNRPDDRGNWTSGRIGVGALKGTKYGISAMSYPSEDDIKGLTLSRAREIYRRDFWGPAGCDVVPPAVRCDLFDFAVHSGVRAAVRALQRAVAETEDGVIGPRTLRAIGSMPTARLLARFAGVRLLLLTEAKAWPTYGRGWTRRVATNLLEA